MPYSLLLPASTTTRAANMSGLPKVRARRRFADATDDVARTSAEILERLLNSDIDREDDGYRKSLARARSDWELAGLGVAGIFKLKQQRRRRSDI